MTSRLLLLSGVALALVVGAASSSASWSSRAARCASLEGTVLGNDPTTSHSCSAQTYFGQSLYAGETVKSAGVGDFTFQTSHLHSCIQYATPDGTADTLRPRPGVALKHLRGKTWCRHLSSDDRFRKLITPGATIKLLGTIFGIDSDGKSSIVKVLEGKVSVLSTTGQQVRLAAGQQALFRRVGKPGKPRPLVLRSNDARAAANLQLDATPMGTDQVVERLHTVGQRGAVVVGPDAATLAPVQTALKRSQLRTCALTAADLQGQPELVGKAAANCETQTVVVAAPSATAVELLTAVRKAAPQLSIVFVDTAK